MPKCPTPLQLETLADLRDGEWKYGINVRTRRCLPSLAKAGLVFQQYGERSFGYTSADRWKITPAGLEALRTFGTIAHLRCA